MPQNESNMDNIRDFAIGSIESGSNGLLLTLWDDDSPHFELYIRGIVAFAEYTWSGDKRNKESIKSAYRQREFSNELADLKNGFIDTLEEPVAFWKNGLLKGNKRNLLKAMDNALVDGVIDMPNKDKKGEWSITYAERLKEADKLLAIGNRIAKTIADSKQKAVRNSYTLAVYEKVNELTHFTPKILLALKTYDNAKNLQEERKAIKNLTSLQGEFKELRASLETVYGKIRILNKPDDYILDEDHHSHLANQSHNFDWQFYAEELFFKKLSKSLENAIYIENADNSKR